MNESVTNSLPIILAAGGIVHRRTLRGWRIAVVHRKRYNDWSLPKGKLEHNETPDKAALREIKEETGCEGTIVGFSGTTQYVVGDTQKVVFYWNVKVTEAVTFIPSGEIDQIEWLSRQDAIKRLTYEHEKILVSQTTPVCTIENPCLSRCHYRWLQHHRRLYNAIESTRVEIDFFLEQGYAQKENYFNRIASALKSLSLAEQGLRDLNINGGWMHLHNTRRELLFLFDNSELAAKLAVQRREAAEKLSAWRFKAYCDLLPENAIPNVTNIAEAQNLLDEHANNRWLKIWTLRSQLQIIVSVMGLVIIGIMLSAWTQPLFKQNATDGDWQFILGITLFGVLGASFSGALSVANEKTGGRIPDQVVSNWITLMRLALGGGAAIAVYCFLQMKILNIGEVSKPPGFFGISFVAGFGERLVIRAVETLSGKHTDISKNITQK